MSQSRLAKILAPDAGSSFQWEAVVPIVTNPFIIMELCQMAFMAAAIGLVTMASGIWLVGGGLQPGDISFIFKAAGVFFLTLVIVFSTVSILFFGNRYFALYHCTPSGIYHQSTRGMDESGKRFTLALRPFPVEGMATGKTVRAKDLPWDKVDHFIDFASMRSVQLKRGRWHLLRVYSPDEETHERLVAFLAGRLRQKSA